MYAIGQLSGGIFFVGVVGEVGVVGVIGVVRVVGVVGMLRMLGMLRILGILRMLPNPYSLILPLDHIHYIGVIFCLKKGKYLFLCCFYIFFAKICTYVTDFFINFAIVKTD